jgi:hypothetical protein
MELYRVYLEMKKWVYDAVLVKRKVILCVNIGDIFCSMI